jgi:hypothetical protein
MKSFRFLICESIVCVTILAVCRNKSNPSNQSNPSSPSVNTDTTKVRPSGSDTTKVKPVSFIRDEAGKKSYYLVYDGLKDC